MKYTEEVKKQVITAAKEGTSLKAIQEKYGPNPKATQRYLAKEGIDYKKLRVELREAGKLKGNTKENGAKKPKHNTQRTPVKKNASKPTKVTVSG